MSELSELVREEMYGPDCTLAMVLKMAEEEEEEEEVVVVVGLCGELSWQGFFMFSSFDDSAVCSVCFQESGNE